MSRSFDEWIVLIAKWIAVFVGFCIVFAFQFIWFIIFPLILFIRNKINKSELQTEMNFFSPIEWYGKFVRRFFGLD